MALEGWQDADRVAFFDPDEDVVWTADPGAIAEGLEQFGGYFTLRSAELRTWLARRIERGAEGTLCVFLQGVVPTGVADEPYLECPVRRYLEVGGRIVWIGYHIPFGCVGSTLGRHTNRGDPAMRAILGVEPVYEHGYMKLLTTRLVLNPRFAQSGFLQPDHGAASARWDSLERLMRAAADGIGEPMPGHSLFTDEREAAAPEAPPAGGVLVGSGSFKVDRGRALEKLGLYQLPDATMFVLPLLRFAAAAKAAAVTVDARLGRLVVDARDAELAGEALDDPWAALFDDEAGAARQQLAIGLLASLRTRPTKVVVSCPLGSVVVRSVDDHERVGGELLPGGVRIEVEWGLSRVLAWSGSRAAAHARAAAGTGRVALRVQRKLVEALDFEHDLPSLAFEEAAVRGRIQVPLPLAFSSTLDIHHLGVRAARTRVNTHPAQVRGILDADGVGLNLSQTGVVRDPRFDAMLEGLREPILRLIDKVLPEHMATFPRVARAVVDGAGPRGLWKSYLDHPGGSDGPARRLKLRARRGLAGLGLRDSSGDGLIRTAFVAAWLRMTVGNLPGDHPLRDAPLYFAADGGTLSLRRLEQLRQERGKIPCADEPYPGHPEAACVLYLCSTGDRRTLESYWSSLVYPTRELAEGLPLPR